MTEGLKVVEFPTIGVREIPRLLRVLAEDIEEGKYGAINALVITGSLEDGIATWGLGNCNDILRVVGLLAAAQHRLLAHAPSNAKAG